MMLGAHALRAKAERKEREKRDQRAKEIQKAAKFVSETICYGKYWKLLIWNLRDTGLVSFGNLGFEAAQSFGNRFIRLNMVDLAYEILISNQFDLVEKLNHCLSPNRFWFANFRIRRVYFPVSGLLKCQDFQKFTRPASNKFRNLIISNIPQYIHLLTFFI
jgi:hypothetical protein